MVDSEGRIIEVDDDPMLGEPGPNRTTTHPTEPQHRDGDHGQSSSHDHSNGAASSSGPERRQTNGIPPKEPEYAMAGEKRSTERQ